MSTDVSTIHQLNLQIASATEAQNRMASEVGQSMVQVREAALQGRRAVTGCAVPAGSWSIWPCSCARRWETSS